MKNKFKKVAITAALIAIIAATFTGCASIQRDIKSLESDWSGGLNRTVTVYSVTGEEIAKYEGKIDLEITDGGKVLFDLDGKRHIYYNCLVEVIEN